MTSPSSQPLESLQTQEEIDVGTFSAKELPPYLVSKAEKECNEKVSERAKELEAFRETVRNQHDLKSRTDDNFLLRFLRTKKFDRERALEMLRNYYKQRQKYPEIYKNLLASSMPHVLAEPNLGPLSQKDSDGRTIFVLNSTELWDPSVVNVDDCIRYCLLSFERIVQEEEAQINGVVFIVDCKGFGLRHFLAARSPFQISKLISLSISSFPVRFKGAHIINAPVYFKLAFHLLKTFLSRKIIERCIMYSDSLTFHERLDPEILPKEFGGKMRPFSNTEWNLELVANDRVMKWNAKFGFLPDFLLSHGFSY